MHILEEVELSCIEDLEEDPEDNARGLAGDTQDHDDLDFETQPKEYAVHFVLYIIAFSISYRRKKKPTLLRVPRTEVTDKARKSGKKLQAKSLPAKVSAAEINIQRRIDLAAEKALKKSRMPPKKKGSKTVAAKTPVTVQDVPVAEKDVQPPLLSRPRRCTSAVVDYGDDTNELER